MNFINDVFAEVDRVDRDDAFTYTGDDRFPVPAPSPDDRSAPESLGVIAADSVEACASAVACEIERLLASGQVRDRDTGMTRAVRSGDVAILFRSQRVIANSTRLSKRAGSRHTSTKASGFSTPAS